MNAEVLLRIRRLLGLILFAFLVLIGWQSYWQLRGLDPSYARFLQDQQTNKRLARAERDTPRGAIFDRRGTKLAWSEGGTRHYADPQATAGVLGYMNLVHGRVGVEGAWDPELAGIGLDTAGEVARIRAGEPRRGADLVVTLDMTLQQAAIAALGARKGAVVALDPATGAIRALVTYPTFNPETLDQDWERLSADNEAGALTNRAAQGLYPPGSTMKVLTAAAALMHQVRPSVTYTCTGNGQVGGAPVRDYHGEVHGTIDMARALQKSCNFYFASTAANLGAEMFFQTASDFGFNRDWRKEKLPDPRMLPLDISQSSLSAKDPARVSKGELAHMGFGQSTVVATPLQMAMVSAAVANGGTLMAPYLVSEVRKGGTTEALRHFDSVPIGYPLTGEAARTLATMMRGVVTGGTATGINGVRGLTVYGKTGTAEKDGGNDHAWFIGFAERPRNGATERLAFAVLVERGGTGGQVAVPVARALLEAWRGTE